MDADSDIQRNQPDTESGAPRRRAEDKEHSFVARGADRRGPSGAPFDAPFPLPLFSCDASGAVIGYNEAAAALWGRRPDKSEPNQWSGALSLLDARGRPLARSDFPTARAYQSGADVIGAQLTLLRPDGTARSVKAYAKPTNDGNGIVREVVCALIDNTEREDLAAAADQAQDEKNAFLAMLSHELRNPLSPILSAALMLKRLSNDSQVSKMADVVERQAKRLSRFTQDLLAAANLAQGGVALALNRATLADVMQAAIDELAPLASSRAQIVAVESFRNVELMCDADRVSQAISNVMVNASEFTGRDGLINIGVSVAGAWLTVEVKDNGIGVEAARIEEIFQPYTHFATHAERTRSGAGLGLALAKDICEKHGGSITARSDGVGLGSVFTLSLPIALDLNEPDLN